MRPRGWRGVGRAACRSHGGRSHPASRTAAEADVTAERRPQLPPLQPPPPLNHKDASRLPPPRATPSPTTPRLPPPPARAPLHGSNVAQVAFGVAVGGGAAAAVATAAAAAAAASRACHSAVARVGRQGSRGTSPPRGSSPPRAGSHRCRRRCGSGGGGGATAGRPQRRPQHGGHSRGRWPRCSAMPHTPGAEHPPPMPETTSRACRRTGPPSHYRRYCCRHR